MILGITQFILSIISGLAVGFTLGLIGGGGSILAIPLLLYVVGIHDAHLVIGTTALAVGVNAYINFYAHRRKGNVRFGVGALFSIIGAIGVFAGSTVGLLTNSGRLLFLFSLLMIAVGVRMYIAKGRRLESSDNDDFKEQELKTKYGKVSLFSVLTGFASGFFGIGGGFLIVPAIMYSTKIKINEAIGTSLLVVGTFGLLTAARYAISGDLIYSISIFFIAGGIFGGILGSKISASMDTSLLRRIFSIIIVAVGVYVMAKVLMG